VIEVARQAAYYRSYVVLYPHKFILDLSSNHIFTNCKKY